MRKLLSGIPVFMLMVAMTACAGNKSSSDATAGDADSGSAASVATMVTADMSVAEVKGNVKSVKTSVFKAVKHGDSYDMAKTSLETISYGFDETGRLIAYSEIFTDGNFARYNFTLDYDGDSFTAKVSNLKDASRAIVVERDADGRIVRLADSHETDEDRDEAWTWTDGRLTAVNVTCWEWSEGWTFTYDEKGLVASRVDTWEEYEESSKTTSTYTYLKFDENGNWTERAVKLDTVGLAWDNETEKMVTTGTEPSTYRLETRVIEYY